MTVLELLDELEDILEAASPVPLTGGKIMVDKNEIASICEDIRVSLPDDVKQARWLKDEKERILEDAKSEYNKLVNEAKKQADYLVDNNDITMKARKQAEAVNEAADNYSKLVKVRTYDYLDKMLYDMQEKMQAMNDRYFGELYDTMAGSFEGIQTELDRNRKELKRMAERAQNGEEWMYQNNGEEA